MEAHRIAGGGGRNSMHIVKKKKKISFTIKYTQTTHRKRRQCLVHNSRTDLK